MQPDNAASLHLWTRSPKSEPLRCAKCGGYYSDPKLPFNCPGGKVPSDQAASMREYVCPECGYDGFKASAPRFYGVTDVALTWCCPRCKTVDARVVELVETTDPRSVA